MIRYTLTGANAWRVTQSVFSRIARQHGAKRFAYTREGFRASFPGASNASACLEAIKAEVFPNGSTLPGVILRSDGDAPNII